MVGAAAIDGERTPLVSRPAPNRGPLLAVRGTSRPIRHSSLNLTFCLVFLAHLLALTAATLMYRFGDFVTFLGGTELELGEIVGVGMIGSLAMRLLQGAGIDRYGPREIWLLSLAMLSLSMAGHLFITNPNHAEIFLLQAVYRISIAGVLGASFSYVSYRLPVDEMATAIGTLGIAGMLAMLIGPVIGDYVMQGAIGATAAIPHGPDRTQLDRLFILKPRLSGSSHWLSLGRPRADWGAQKNAARLP